MNTMRENCPIVTSPKIQALTTATFCLKLTCIFSFVLEKIVIQKKKVRHFVILKLREREANERSLNRTLQTRMRGKQLAWVLPKGVLIHRFLKL